MSTKVDASVMVPSQRSHPHGPPSLRRVRLPTVPRLQRYSAVLRLPLPRQPRLRSPLAFGLPRRRLFSSPPWTRSAYVRASESNHRPLRCTGLSPRRDEGLPGAWAVLFVRAVVQDPAECNALLTHLGGTCRGLQASQNPGHPGCDVSGADSPRLTRSRAYASTTPSPRPLQGSLPTRAGSPLAGRASHPLDDLRSFKEASHPPFPFDQPCLVASGKRPL